MLTKQNDNLYQEYADMMARENGDYFNTAEFAQKLSNSPVWEWTDKLANYNQILLNHALSILKTRKEWQDAEADDIRHSAYGALKHMNAMDLLERYQNKIQKSYNAEQWHMRQICDCDAKILELNNWNTISKRKTNILKHWRERRVICEAKYQEQVQKSHRYERLIYKWMMICDAIRQSDIAHEIVAEREGVGNKYGFNTNMQSRDTATGVFED